MNHSYAMKRSIIKSTGRHVPDRRVPNEELTELMDTSNEWIVQRTGIEAGTGSVKARMSGHRILRMRLQL